MFDVPVPNATQLEDLEAYLVKRADGIKRCWVPDRPVYVDVHDFPLEIRVRGVWPIIHLVDGLMSRGLRPIPVCGTVSERGSEYVHAVRRLAARNGYGACLRIERDEIDDSKALSDSIAETLALLDVPTESVDVILDFGFVGRETAQTLRSIVSEALHVVRASGQFRNLAVAGGSVPEQLPKRDTGVVRREPRIEFDLWAQVLDTDSAMMPLAFGDFGVISPLYVPPSTPVNVPARIRYTTIREHVFLRTGRSGHNYLCTELVASEDFACAGFSAGDQRMALAARGLASPGNPGMWVGDDLNHHLELVSAQVWDAIRAKGLSRYFALPEPIHYPWLQRELTDE